MTIEELFYLLGIISMVAWLVFLVAISVISYILYKRYSEAKTTLKQSAVAALGMRLLSPKPLTGILTLLPVAQFFVSKFKKSKRS